MKAAVMGAGQWGTTFAQVLCDAGTPTELWARRAEPAEAINASHENPGSLPGIVLTPDLHATGNAAEALAGADVVVLAVPAQTLRDNLTAWCPLLPPEAARSTSRLIGSPSYPDRSTGGPASIFTRCLGTTLSFLVP